MGLLANRPAAYASPRSTPAVSRAVPLVGPAHQTAGGVWIVDSEYECDRLRERLQDIDLAGVDTETKGCNPREESPIGKAAIVVWSMSWLDPALGPHPRTGRPLGNRVFIANYGEAEAKGWLYKFQPWLEDPTKKKVGHNFFSYDRHVFKNHGIEVVGIYCDTMRASRLSDVTQDDHDLKTWGGSEELGYQMPGEFSALFSTPKPLKNGGVSIRDRILVPLEDVVKDPAWLDILIDYSTMDPKVSLELLPIVQARLEAQPWKGTLTMWDYYCQRMNPHMYVITAMEQTGQPIDAEWCYEMSAKAEKDLGEVEKKLVSWAGCDLNFGSWQQLQHFLYGQGTKAVTKEMEKAGQRIPGRGFPVPPMAREGKLPTYKDALQWLADHVSSKRDREHLRLLVQWRKIDGTKTKYLDKLPRFMDANGRVHCQVGPDTETMRLAARHPPQHQIPKPEEDDYKVRVAFTAPPGMVFIGGDWKQVEMRILAHFLIVLFKDHTLADDLERGDVYSATAMRTWPLDEAWEAVRQRVGILSPDGMWTKEELVKFATLTGIPRDFPLGLVKGAFKKRRADAKIVDLSINYGKTEYGLGYDLRDEEGNPIGKNAAGRILGAYRVARAPMFRYQAWAIDYATKRGYARSLGGCYRKIPQLHWQSKAAQSHGRNQAMNTPIQTTAANLAADAQLYTNAVPIPELIEMGYFNEVLYDCQSEHTMQVHDELHFLAPKQYRNEVTAEVKRVMEGTGEHFGLLVPTPVDIAWGVNWDEVKN